MNHDCDDNYVYYIEFYASRHRIVLATTLRREMVYLVTDIMSEMVIDICLLDSTNFQKSHCYFNELYTFGVTRLSILISMNYLVMEMIFTSFV
jgi:hypothetical protein